MSGSGCLLVFCEPLTENTPAAISFEMIGLGREIADELSVELAAVAPKDIANEVIAHGAGKVFTAEKPADEGYNPEWYVAFLEEVCNRADPVAVLFGHTSLGQDVAPRLAQRLGAGLATDATAVNVEEKKLPVTKQVQGGVGIATYSFNSTPQIVTVRPRVGNVPDRDESGAAEVIEIDVTEDAGKARWEVIDRVIEEGGDIKLDEAEVVVSGGRGIGGSEEFDMVRELAREIGAAVGSSRPPCDLGWMPSSQQVGITGTVISPQVYFAIGISGASQHLSGMCDSKTIIAVNKDPDADIFKVANYGVVGDYRQVLPAIIDTIKENKNFG